MIRIAHSEQFIISGLLFSILIGLIPENYAASPINSFNDGQIIQGGSYYNTSSSKTTFFNSRSGDLWLQSGVTVRGVEITSNGNFTNNGGNILLYAPGKVVRLDGNINASALVNGQGAYLGNGGKVAVNSAYLFQNGNILALGAQGGHVSINVNSATFGPLSRIDAGGGTTGIGGAIRVKATGVVDVQKGAVLNTTGVPFPGLDSNVIQIIGAVVNNEGIISANGVSSNLGQNMNASKGGVIQLVANGGNINLQPTQNAISGSTVLTPAEGKVAYTRIQALAANYGNGLRNSGSITANGGTLDSTSSNQGGDGGAIVLSADQKILNQSSGIITANGGHGNIAGQGGKIDWLNNSSFQNAQNNGLLQANGGVDITPVSGGKGGVISLRNMTNTGIISALGGESSGLGGGHGGTGGIISSVNLMNTKTGSLDASGGGGSGPASGFGGSGGLMTALNLNNMGSVKVDGGYGSSNGNSLAGIGGGFQGLNITNNGSIAVEGGFAVGKGDALGGNGGRMQEINVNNAGTISANGGVGRGVGSGGLLTFAKVSNSSLIEADGGNTYPFFGVSLAAGNGGKIVGAQVTNTGTVQVNGGIGNGGPNGTAGTLIGF